MSRQISFGRFRSDLHRPHGRAKHTDTTAESVDGCAATAFGRDPEFVLWFLRLSWRKHCRRGGHRRERQRIRLRRAKRRLEEYDADCQTHPFGLRRYQRRHYCELLQCQLSLRVREADRWLG